MAQKLIDPKLAERAANRVGHGWTQEEAARAVDVHAPQADPRLPVAVPAEDDTQRITVKARRPAERHLGVI